MKSFSFSTMLAVVWFVNKLGRGTAVPVQLLDIHCDTLKINYDSKVATCQTRYLASGARELYWVSSACFSYPDAQVFCKEKGGKPAALPRMEQKLFAADFLDPFVAGSWSRHECGESPALSSTRTTVHLWLGLTKAGGTWQWDNTESEEASALPFDRFAQADVGAGGDCVQMLRESDSGAFKAGGYVKVPCKKAKSRVLCSKALQDT